jgi:hypothetical protein
MRLSCIKISWIFAAVMMAASVLYSCEPVPPVDKPDQEQETLVAATKTVLETKIIQEEAITWEEAMRPEGRTRRLKFP